MFIEIVAAIQIKYRYILRFLCDLINDDINNDIFIKGVAKLRQHKTLKSNVIK